MLTVCKSVITFTNVIYPYTHFLLLSMLKTVMLNTFVKTKISNQSFFQDYVINRKFLTVLNCIWNRNLL